MSITYPTLRVRMSAARLAPYEAATGACDHTTVALYEWNLSVSAALFHDLSAFEVLFRNAVDLSLRTKYQQTETAPPWWDQVALHEKAKKTLAKAIDRVGGRDGGVDQDKVVAELTFGFWRYLLLPKYQPNVWPFISRALSHAPTTSPLMRVDVEKAVDNLWYLRNRIAHHEPIFSRDLARDYRYLVGLSDRICPETSDWIRHRSQFLAVMELRPRI